MKKMDYKQYLKSSAWKTKRLMVLHRDNFKCQRCDSRATDIHHLTYEHIFNEPLGDLISLCRDCHESIHIDPQYGEYFTYEEMIEAEIRRLMENPNA